MLGVHNWMETDVVPLALCHAAHPDIRTAAWPTSECHAGKGGATRVQFKMSDLVYILAVDGALWVGASVLKAIEKLVEDKLAKSIRAAITPDVSALQSRLFGLHQQDFAPLHGFNKWRSENNPARCYGEELQGYPIPPYNYEGLHRLAAVHADFERVFSVTDEHRVVTLRHNLMLMGGAPTNVYVGGLLDQYPDLPYRFVDAADVAEEYRAGITSGAIRRVYTDADGRHWWKNSKTGKFLVNAKSPDIPPLGPFVDEPGRITCDVVLVTIVPKRPLKRMIWVTAGYGAAVRLPDILCNGHVLEQMCSRAFAQHASPWIQAAFTVPVEHGDYHEHYGMPELVDIVHLGHL